DMADHQAVDVLSDPAGVGVEECRDAEAAAGEAGVIRQRVPEVTHADERYRPARGEPEDVLDLADQRAYVVAHTAGAIRTQVREVLAQLGRIHPGSVGERLAGNGVVTRVGEVMQSRQILRQT